MVTALLDSNTREALAARLRFYRELGLGEFYRRPVSAELVARFAASAQATGPQASVVEEPLVHETRPAQNNSPEPNLEAAPVQAVTPPALELANIAQPLVQPVAPVASTPKTAAEALVLIREELGNCQRCPLHKGRNKLVFGDGNPQARLMFVGEGPGVDEDAQGLPFVGRAGQLLNNMISAMGLKREEVYIANVVKCRPPGNRTPEPDESATCSPFLFEQIRAVQPQVLVALGSTAATCLLGARQPLAGLRGRIHAVHGAQLIVTYHPAYLLRDPRMKREAWADLQIAMRELGLTPPARK